jgi:hypothetical protein
MAAVAKKEEDDDENKTIEGAYNPAEYASL